MIEERPLDTDVHDRAGFDCGIPELNEYLKRFARQDIDRNYGRVFVLVDSEVPDEVLGYYALSTAQIAPSELGDADRRKLPSYPVPCIRLGRLAIANRQQGRGFGRKLLGLAVSRCLAVQKDAGAYALIVDAMDDNAVWYYKRFGFTQFTSQPTSLYLILRIQAEAK